MFETDKTNDATFESRMGGEKKARRCRLPMIAVVALAGLIVGGAFVLSEWPGSGEGLRPASKTALWSVVFGLSTAVTLAGGSRRNCESCWVKKLFRRAGNR